MLSLRFAGISRAVVKRIACVTAATLLAIGTGMLSASSPEPTCIGEVWGEIHWYVHPSHDLRPPSGGTE